MTHHDPNPPAASGGLRPFRRAVLRGLGVVLPSLLTIIFLLWLWNAISTYVLRPIEAGARHLIVMQIAKVYP